MFKTPPVTTDEVESTQQDKIYSGYVRVLQIYWIIDQTWNQRALNSLLLIMFLTLGAAHRASLVTERTNRCRSEALTRDECGSWALLEHKVVVIFLNQTVWYINHQYFQLLFYWIPFIQNAFFVDSK